MAWQDTLGGLLGGSAQVGAAMIPYQATEGVMNDLKAMSNTFGPEAARLGQQASGAAAFQPFTVRTSTGTSAIDQSGGMNQTLGLAPQNIQDLMMAQAQQTAGMQVDPMQYQGLAQQALGQATQRLGQPQVTADSLYAQMQAAQAPEMERTRLDMENRLAAQGRLGVQTNAFGGTPEALAMEKAFQEQQAQNFFLAQQYAPQLDQQNIANSTGLFGLGQQAQMTPAQMQAANFQNTQSALTSAFAPQTQQLATMQPSIQAANIGQSARLGQSEALYKSGMQGLQAQQGVAGGIAQLEAERGNTLGNSLQGMFDIQQSQTVSPAQQGIDSLMKLLGGV